MIFRNHSFKAYKRRRLPSAAFLDSMRMYKTIPTILQ